MQSRWQTITQIDVDQVLWCHTEPLSLKGLTLNVRGPSYLGLTRSISWLLMPWLLTSPGHQQPWYDYVEYVGPGLTWGQILRTCVISMWSNDIKCKCMFMFHLKNLARKGLIWHHQYFPSFLAKSVIFFLSLFENTAWISNNHQTSNLSHTKCQNTCSFLLQNGALWDMVLVHCGICATGLLDVMGHTLI